MRQTLADKLISLFLVLILIVFSTGFAVLYSSASEFVADGVHSFYIGRNISGGVVATFDEGFTTLQIFKNGAKSDGFMKDWRSPNDGDSSYNPCREHADTLKTVIISDGIMNVGNYLFYECSSLESVTLPESVVRIGDSAFRKTGITSVSFPSRLKYIGERAFSGCHSLNCDIVIPDSVTGIGAYAFYNCDSIKGTLTFGSSLRKIGEHAFDRCFQIGGSLVFPSSLESIGAYGFENCESLSGNLILNDGLRHIGDGAFNHCKSFTNETLVIPASVETIGGDTAYEVSVYSASPVNPPETLYNHSSHVFYDFANETLTQFQVSSESRNFTSVDGVLFTADMKRLIAYPPSREGESYKVPDGVEIIDEMAFGRTKYSTALNRLKNVYLPDSYVIRNNDDFENTLNREAMCSLSSALYVFTSVENVFVNESNTNYRSVDGCIYSADLKKLICVPAGKTGNLFVGEGVEEICYGAFAGCKSLGYVIIPDAVGTVSDVAFNNVNSADIICYKDSAAQSLSGNSGCNIHLFGDLNDDGEIKLNDYIIIKKHIATGFVLNSLQVITGDYNRDNAVDGFDLYEVDKLING